MGIDKQEQMEMGLDGCRGSRIQTELGLWDILKGVYMQVQVDVNGGQMELDGYRGSWTQSEVGVWGILKEMYIQVDVIAMQ